mmetsp:Transcript_22702/g.34983  ORF Transcript_22702/g.34983 Transcript_22702/m.34983 type:complete len:86 (+) Transcript_22702:210-467(+)
MDNLEKLILLQKNKHSSKCLLENVKKRYSSSALNISYHSLKMEDPSPSNDRKRRAFISEHLYPYLSSVFFSLVKQQKSRRAIGKF